MKTHPMHPGKSERGVALIIVLLLLAVMSGLTTGLTLNGQTEIAMATNELHYAGARAAAEAGLNRATEVILADTTTNLMAGPDGLFDAANPLHASNADNGRIPVIGNGPFDIGSQYSYTLQIVDDDDPSLYPTALTAAQLTKMGEDGNAITSTNERLILRATGRGPNGTIVNISRVLQSVATPNITTTNTTMISNPAILVNGDLDLGGGSTAVIGTRGNVHANGSITGTGGRITGDVTATGTVADGVDPDGMKAGGMPPINIPEIKASDYRGLATWVLTSSGTITDASGNVCKSSCPNFSFSGGTWKNDGGAMPPVGTYYVEGSVEVHGTGSSSMTSVSIIAEGNIKLTGNGKFKPANEAKIQFVTNGDFELGGTVDADDTVDMDGQILVREQIKIFGTSEFQGRVMVENRDSASNVYHAVSNPNGNRGASVLSNNTLNGNMTVTYNGALGDIETMIEVPVVGAPTYTNNISGWIEQ